MSTTIFLKQLTALSAQANAFSSITEIKIPKHPINIGSSELPSTKDTTWSDVEVLLKESVGSCEKLITLHQDVKKRIEASGGNTAQQSAKNAAQLEANQKKILELQSQNAALEIEMKSYETKLAKRDADLAWLNARYDEIERRKKSGNQYIPFYGIAYAIETNNMVDDYNRKRNDWIILRDTVSNMRPKYSQNQAKHRANLDELARLTVDNIRLQGESATVRELLTILSQMIVVFQNFISGVQELKNKLEYNTAKKATELKLLVDSSYQKCTDLQKILLNKVNEYRGKLPANILEELNRIM